MLASSRISRAALPPPGIARRRKLACARSLLLFKSNLRFDLSCGSFRLFCSVPFARLGWRRGKKTAAAFLQLPSLCQRRAIFPGRRQPSIVATDELNFRVRNGNGWTLIVIGTDFGDPCGNRTHVWGVRGPRLNLLTNGPDGTPSGTRTLDTLIKSQVLYQLS